MLTTASTSHQSFFSAKMSDATSKINERYYNMRGYFFLRETNQQLARENARLLNLLRSNISAPDSSIQIVTDSVYKDSLNKYRKYSWFPARVIGNTVSLQTNFLKYIDRRHSLMHEQMYNLKKFPINTGCKILVKKRANITVRLVQLL